MSKQIRQVLLIFNWALVSLSAVSLIFVFTEAIQRQLDKSFAGFKEFFEIVSTFSLLYGATFIVLSTIFTIDRLGIMQEANDNTWLSNQRTIWFQIMKELIGEIKVEDKYMYRDFLINSIRLHDHMFELNYGFKNKQELEIFYKLFSQGQVKNYEGSNKKFNSIGVYPNNNHSFSWDSYRFILINIVNSNKCYESWIIDLHELYINDVRIFSKGLIDPEAYNKGIKNGWLHNK